MPDKEDPKKPSEQKPPSNTNPFNEVPNVTVVQKQKSISDDNRVIEVTKIG